MTRLFGSSLDSRGPASLEVVSLCHRYPGAETLALDHVTFSIAPGERVGLLGPNGAGKTTLMRILCGYLPVQNVRSSHPEMQVNVAGFDVTMHSLQVRSRVGYLPEHVPLYSELRVREHLSFRAKLKGVNGQRARQRELERVVGLTGLEGMQSVPIQELSRGYRQRVGIADALLGSPSLVVLDEPTVGLDPNQVLDIRAMLRALGGAQTLLFSSHVLAEVETLCDRVLILARGSLVVDESLDRAVRTREVSVQVEATLAQAQPALSAACQAVADLRPRLDVLERQSSTYASVELEAQDDQHGHVDHGIERVCTAIGRECARCGLAIVRLEHTRTRLEQRFARATGAVSREQASGTDDAPKEQP